MSKHVEFYSFTHVWVTDARSVYDNLAKESMSTSEDKRMAIEAALLRETLAKPSAHLRWIDVSHNVASQSSTWKSPTSSRIRPQLPRRRRSDKQDKDESFRGTTCCKRSCVQRGVPGQHVTCRQSSKTTTRTRRDVTMSWLINVARHLHLYRCDQFDFV